MLLTTDPTVNSLQTANRWFRKNKTKKTKKQKKQIQLWHRRKQAAVQMDKQAAHASATTNKTPDPCPKPKALDTKEKRRRKRKRAYLQLACLIAPMVVLLSFIAFITWISWLASGIDLNCSKAAYPDCVRTLGCFYCKFDHAAGCYPEDELFSQCLSRNGTVHHNLPDRAELWSRKITSELNHRGKTNMGVICMILLVGVLFCSVALACVVLFDEPTETHKIVKAKKK
jgi:hypothetical protein